MQSETFACGTFVCFVQKDDFGVMNVPVPITYWSVSFSDGRLQLVQTGELVPTTLAVLHFAYNSTSFKCHDHMRAEVSVVRDCLPRHNNT